MSATHKLFTNVVFKTCFLLVCVFAQRVIASKYISDLFSVWQQTSFGD